MTANTWAVDVDGVRHTISVETNPEARRAMIRVDGRLAAKPLTDDETERVITVGTARYVIRRLDGDTFDLDIPPEQFLDPKPAAGPRMRTMNAPAPEPQRRGRVVKIVVGVVAALFVLGLIRIGREGLAYRSVPWKAYQASDGSFKVEFAGDPTQKESERNIDGDLWKIVTLHSEFRNHYYIVQYIDTHMVMTQDHAGATLNQFFTKYMSVLNAREIATDTSTPLKNPAIHFSAVIPKGTGDGDEKLNIDGRMKGVLVMREKRLLIAYTLAANADAIMSDRDKFLASFEVVPPAAQPEHLISSVAAPPQDTVAPVKAAAPAPTAEKTLGATVARVYADAETKTYWPPECAGRPPKAYPVPKSLAIKQGFQLASACAK